MKHLMYSLAFCTFLPWLVYSQNSNTTQEVFINYLFCTKENAPQPCFVFEPDSAYCSCEGSEIKMIVQNVNALDIYQNPSETGHRKPIESGVKEQVQKFLTSFKKTDYQNGEPELISSVAGDQGITQLYRYHDQEYRDRHIMVIISK